MQEPLIILASIVVMGAAAQWLAWRVKLPAILFLLIIGIMAGPITNFLSPADLFGESLFPAISLAVGVILFEGSLTLHFSELRHVGGPIIRLVTVGAAVSWVLLSAAAHYLLGINWEVSFLIGALATVTGPTVVVPMLRAIHPKQELNNILRWEGIIIDPIGAVLAVMVFEFIVAQAQGNAGLGDAYLWIVLAKLLLAGGVIGAVGAMIMGFLLRRHLLPWFLRDTITLAMVVAVFAAADHVQAEAGLVAVTVMGVVLGNLKGVDIEDILNFKESLTVLLVSLLFIILAARLELEHVRKLQWDMVLFLGAMLFLIRPIVVLVSTLGSKLGWKERALVSWVAPRGIVAAAVSALLAIKLQAMNYPDADLLVPVIFAVIIVTVVLVSATAGPIARRLDVADPARQGVILVGANNVARTLGDGLRQQGVRVLVADTNWHELREARMAGMETYFGQVVSEHADRNLDLVGYGRLLALSRRPALNILACMRYRTEFSTEGVFALKTSEEKNSAEKHQVAGHMKMSWLFGEDISNTTLSSMIGQGAAIRTTRLTENFSFSDYCERLKPGGVPLFAFNPEGNMHIFATDRDLQPKAGWKVMSLLPKELLDVEFEPIPPKPAPDKVPLPG